MKANNNAKEVAEDEADDDEALWRDQYSDCHQRSHQLGDGGTFYFVKLPHKDGGENNVGNPLAKDFLDKLKDGILATASASGMAGRVLLSAKSGRRFIRTSFGLSFGMKNGLRFRFDIDRVGTVNLTGEDSVTGEISKFHRCHR